MAKVTQKDVVREAGVSAMPVSKALSQKPGASEQTRQMRYTQNLVAGDLRVDET